MIINTNLSALSAFNALNKTNKKLNKSLKELSTGLRINSASDDAAGFAISERIRSQVRGLDTALRNTQDGVSLIQTAEGALGETNAMLSRMRELAVQASNDSLTSQDRQYVQLEIDELKKQIDRIAGTTQFNRKRLLDGSSGASWSSSDAGLKARINGGLTYTDSFGQKVSSEGNYKLEVKAEPGRAQVQKSNIFNLDFVEEVTRIEYVTVESNNVPAIIDDIVLEQIAEKIEIENLSAGDHGNGWSFDGTILTIEDSGTYAIMGTNQPLTDRRVKISEDISATVFLSDVTIDRSAGSRVSGSAFEIKPGASVDMYIKGNNYISGGYYHAGIEAPRGTKLSISSISGDGSTDGTLEVHGGDYGAGIGGSGQDSRGYSSFAPSTASSGSITISGGDIEAYGGFKGAGIGSGHFAFVNPDTVIKIAGGTIKAYGGSDGNLYNGAGIGGGCHSDSGTILIKEGLVQWLDKANGVVDPNSSPVFAQKGIPGSGNTAQDIGHGTDSTGSVGSLTESSDITVTPCISPASQRIPVAISDISVRPSSIKDIMKFYNSDGVFLVDEPKTIKITQGNGKTTEVTLYSSDSIYDVADKINNAISEGLGQKVYTDNSEKFCTIASGPDATSESVCVKEDAYRTKYQRNENGNLVLDSNNNPIVIGTEYSGKRLTYSTMVIRSGIPGQAGELYFSGDEDLLNALGLNTIRESSESTYTASIYDAHSGTRISEMKSDGPEFPSIIPPEIDVEIDPMSGITSRWDEGSKRYVLSEGSTYSAYLHLKDSTITFQTGANQGEDFAISLGDSSSRSLGVSTVSVVTRETASRAISTIDRAITRVSSQRAKLGAYTNALEHTMTNLTTASMNLTATDSRIRDADMSQAMMEFVKLQILNQSGTSMLAQANQLPQSVLSLMS